MNGIDRPSFGERINYSAFKLIYIKGIYNFLIKISIEPSSDLSKKMLFKGLFWLVRGIIVLECNK